jgi:chromosome segregation ATPase
MKQQWTYSIFRGLGIKTSEAGGRQANAPGLTDAALEQAYRELLLENQVLTESNRRLHDRLARAESGLVDTPASRQLIRAQRDALTDRSRQLRELHYANRTLQRERQKLQDNNRRLAEKLARQAASVRPLERQLEASQAEVVTLKQQLGDQRRELATLTDRYYQLQARIDPALSADRVVKVDF